MTSRPLIHRLRLHCLLIVPILLAILVIVLLFVHADLNIPALYSQCHARSRLGFLSHIPVIGAPSCFLVSIFQFATASARGCAHMGVVIAFVGALLTVNLVESARICNRPSKVIRSPTFPWLIFNLVAGTLMWDLVIIPSFLRRAKNIQTARESASAEEARDADPEIDKEIRCLSSQVEAVAIPIAVAVGFFAPSILMIVFNHPVVILVWLFFPLWVGAIRYLVKVVGVNAVKDPGPYNLEAHRTSVITMYIVPVICSIAAHVFFIWSVFTPEDRREMTRSTIKLVEIDISFIGLTVLYWVLVEAGILVILKSIIASVILGPGAGLCVSWVLRESAIEKYLDMTTLEGDTDEEATDEGRERNSGNNDEQTPLLR